MREVRVDVSQRVIQQIQQLEAQVNVLSSRLTGLIHGIVLNQTDVPPERLVMYRVEGDTLVLVLSEEDGEVKQ